MGCRGRQGTPNAFEACVERENLENMAAKIESLAFFKDLQEKIMEYGRTL
jgi:hypothetical protein